MKIALTIEVHLRFVEGKFEPKDDIAELLREEIEGMDPGEVEGDNGGRYEIDAFDVQVAS